MHGGGDACGSARLVCAVCGPALALILAHISANISANIALILTLILDISANISASISANWIVWHCGWP